MGKGNFRHLFGIGPKLEIPLVMGGWSPQENLGAVFQRKCGWDRGEVTTPEIP